jgi:hypothetical protein
MTATRKIVTIALSGALMLGVAPGLVACSTAGQLVQDAVGGAVGDAVKDATGLDVNLDGKTLPEGFPAEIAIVGGEISQSGALGLGTEKVWTVGVTVSDLTAGFEEAKTKLLDAGFTATAAGAEGLNAGIFSNAAYSVLVTATEDATGKTVTYVVTSLTAQ